MSVRIKLPKSVFGAPQFNKRLFKPVFLKQSMTGIEKLLGDPPFIRGKHTGIGNVHVKLFSKTSRADLKFSNTTSFKVYFSRIRFVCVRFLKYF